jgi:hypothetical protein
MQSARVGIRRKLLHMMKSVAGRKGDGKGMGAPGVSE